MKIEKIEIKGLFGKKDIFWKLNPQVNVLVGENGSGKSTILSIIYCMLNDLPNSHRNMIFDVSEIHFKDDEVGPILRKNNKSIDLLKISKDLAENIHNEMSNNIFGMLNNIPEEKKKILSLRLKIRKIK